LNSVVKESVLDVVARPANASGVSALTVGTGLSTYLSVIPEALGVVASITGSVLAIALTRNALLKRRMMLMEIERREREEGLSGD